MYLQKHTVSSILCFLDYQCNMGQSSSLYRKQSRAHHPLSFAPRYMLKCKTIIPNLITCGSNTISKLSCKNAPGMKLTCYNQAQTSTAGYPC